MRRLSVPASAGRILLLLACAFATTGCITTQITPPPPSGDDVPIFVTDYSRHSSILLPASQGHYVEYAFGDFDWFALSETGASDGFRALFFSAGSTLGRRQLNLPENADPAAVAKETEAERALRIEVPRDKASALLEQLDDAYFARYDTITYNPASSMWFVRSREPYNALHNCNNLTARWLRELGCKVRGTALFSKFRISPRR